MFRRTVIILVILLFAISLMSVAGCGCKKEEATTPGATVEENTATTQTAAQTATQTAAQTAAQTAVEPPPPAPVELMVVVTRTGDKYHTSGCRYVTGKTDTRTIPLSQAKAEGYTPCSVCNPPT